MHTLSRRSVLAGCAGAAVARISSARAETRQLASTAMMSPLEDGAVARLAALHEGLLSGRVYLVATGKNDEPARGQDLVRFTGTMMSTDLCDRFGFQPAPYHLRADGNALHVMATLTSASQGELRFAGRMAGDRLEAEADWRRPRWYGDVHVRIWFDGTLADPAGDHAVWLD
jgi:hypothetical protein